jgi:protein translocase SecG subunit
MTILEKLWTFIGLLVILLILTTESKGNSINTEVAGLFASATESQNFLRRFTWVLIATFFVLTISINYF